MIFPKSRFGTLNSNSDGGVVIKWDDDGILLAVSDFGEGDSIASFFTRKNGRCRGVVKGGGSRKMRGEYIPSHFFSLQFKARLEEQLGSFRAEPSYATSVFMMSDKKRFLSLSALTSLLETALPERLPFPKLFDQTQEHLCGLHQETWLLKYAFLEFFILKELGYGLDLSSCAVTGKKDGLRFVSPKTGRAVSVDGARGYEEKLLPLPSFLLERPGTRKLSPPIEDLRQSFVLTGYFLNKHVFSPFGKMLPPIRGVFLGHALKK